VSTISTTRPARLTAARVIKLMHAACVLRCSYSPTVWALDNGWEVSAPVADKVMTNPNVTGAGDCLFGPELSQTFRVKN